MARLDEIAEGIAKMLHLAPLPEPLSVQHKNETPAATAVLVRAVIDACSRHGAPLSRVAVCPVLGIPLLREHGQNGYEGIDIAGDENLAGCVAFYRTPNA